MNPLLRLQDFPPEEKTAPPAESGPPLVLVVEDDPAIRFLLKFIMKQHGWRVSEAVDGPQGLAAIRSGPVPEAVLLDIMLPGLDGLELLALLRAQPGWRHVPVMMLTAKGGEPSVKRAFALGANDYLMKPFDPADLAARVKRMARRPEPV